MSRPARFTCARERSSLHSSIFSGGAMRTRVLWILLGLSLVALPAIATAPTVTGTIQGSVTDASGGALPGASIQVRNLETGATRELTTNEVGFYNAPFIPV